MPHLPARPDADRLSGSILFSERQNVLNTTVTDTTGGGFLTVSPDPNTLDQYKAGAASWPVQSEQLRTQLAAGPRPSPTWSRPAPAPTASSTSGTPGFGSTDLVVDAFGFYQND